MPKEMSFKLFLFVLVLGVYSFFVLTASRPSIEAPRAAIANEAQSSQSSLAPQDN